ncbi:UNVERIFIED_CONTAM: hypothetical protein PYX00_002974 [Menopon gallinae]|uniref:Ribosomal protein L1 n=1 Tax=Menopon gallinae TaxID=328185 RepID=A0AAW2HYD2_9NEOP
MAFSLAGILGRLSRPSFYGLGLFWPEMGSQSRGFAARKGTREKALKKKRAQKLKKAAMAASVKKKQISSSSVDVDRTQDFHLPPVPTDMNVYYSDAHQYQSFTLPEALKFHRENLHANILNSEDALIQLFIELDLTAEKKTKVIPPWKNILKYPNLFDYGFKKKILVLCEEKYVMEAREKGADLAGGVNTIKLIRKGEIDLTQFDTVIGHMDIYQDINGIRSKLLQKMPRLNNGSLTMDIFNAIQRFKYGIEYGVNLSAKERNFGWIEMPLGKLDMENDMLEENLTALIVDILWKKPLRDGDFITWIWCSAPPSKERFKIAIEPYVKAAIETAKSQNAAESSIVSSSSA